MKAIIKLTLRSIKSFFSRYLALLLIVLLGVGFFSGLKITKQAMADTLSEYLENTSFYDFRIFSTLGFSEDSISAFEKINGVKDVEGENSVSALMEISGNTDAYIVYSLPENINVPKNSYMKNSNECVVDSKAFSKEDIGKTIKLSDENTEDVKDTLSESEFVITGLVDTPLYIGNDRGTVSIGSGVPKGFIFVKSSDFTNDYYTEIDITLDDTKPIYSDEYDNLIEAFESRIEDVAITEANQRYDDLLDEIEAKAKESATDEAKEKVNENISALPSPVSDEMKNEMVDKAVAVAIKNVPDRESLANEAGLEKPSTYVLTRNDNTGFISFKNDTSILSGIANIFPIFFVLIAMLISITTVSRMVEEERGQIGTLKSLGYSDSMITLKYLLYSGSAALIGDISGFFLGTIFIPKIFWKAYNSIYDFAPINFVMSVPLFLLTLVVSMAGIVGSTYFSCRNSLKEKPAALIRPRELKSGKRILLERIRPLWSNLSFLQKITLRNMFRYKERLIMMLVGISLCTALMVTSFGVRDSMIHISSLQYDEIQKYDLEVGFSRDEMKDASISDADSRNNVSYIENKIKALGDVKQSLPCLLKRTDIKSDDGNMSNISLYSFSIKYSFESFFSLKAADETSGEEATKGYEGNKDKTKEITPDAKNLEFPEKGTALISNKIAETLNISTGDTFEINDADMNTLSVKVAGVFQNYIGNYIIISSNTYEEGFGKYEPDTFLVSLEDKDSASEIAEKLMDISSIVSVTKLTDTKDQVDKALSCVNYIIVLMVVFSGLLAFIVIFNLTNINLAERSREIATVEVLGFYEKETFDYILRENIMSSVIASFIGLPIGFIMHYLVMHMIVVENMSFDIHVSFLGYALSVVFTIIFALIVNLFMRREIRKIPMAESLKAVE